MRNILYILLLSSINCFAQTHKSELNTTLGQTDSMKVKYSLLNPVPKKKMKDMETDRPDVTESAYTVEPGHFQVESDLFEQIRSKDQGLLNVVNVFNLANLKIGLTEKTDLQLVIPTYVSIKTQELNTNKVIDQKEGFGDIILRFKYNVWGNNVGKSALAILPFLSIPTSSFSKNGIQGGLVIPFALEFQNGLNFGTQVAVDITKEDDNRYHSQFLYSFTFSKSLFKKLDAFAEALTTYSTFTKNVDVYANGGIIFSLSKNLNIDAGINYGINKGAATRFFTGFSFRY